jgi:hypothetical protein
VVKIERTRDPHTWGVFTDVAGWLDGGHYDRCIMRKGEGLFGEMQTTPGSYTVIDYISNTPDGRILTKGLFRPDRKT